MPKFPRFEIQSHARDRLTILIEQTALKNKLDIAETTDPTQRANPQDQSDNCKRNRKGPFLHDVIGRQSGICRAFWQLLRINREVRRVVAADVGAKAQAAPQRSALRARESPPTRRECQSW